MLPLVQQSWLLSLLLIGQGLCRQIRDFTYLQQPNYQINVEPDNEICITYVTTYLVSATDGSNSIPVTLGQSIGSDDTLDPGDVSSTQLYIAPGSDGPGLDSTAGYSNSPDATIPASQSGLAGDSSQVRPSQPGNSQGAASPASAGSATTGDLFSSDGITSITGSAATSTATPLSFFPTTTDNSSFSRVNIPAGVPFVIFLRGLFKKPNDVLQASITENPPVGFVLLDTSITAIIGTPPPSFVGTIMVVVQAIESAASPKPLKIRDPGDSYNMTVQIDIGMESQTTASGGVGASSSALTGTRSLEQGSTLASDANGGQPTSGGATGSGGANPSGGVNPSGGTDPPGVADPSGVNPSAGITPSGGESNPSGGVNPSGVVDPSGGVNSSGGAGASSSSGGSQLSTDRGSGGSHCDLKRRHLKLSKKWGDGKPRWAKSRRAVIFGHIRSNHDIRRRFREPGHGDIFEWSFFDSKRHFFEFCVSEKPIRWWDLVVFFILVYRELRVVIYDEPHAGFNQRRHRVAIKQPVKQ